MTSGIRLSCPRMDRGPALVLDDAEALAALFFLEDPSSVGPDSYDASVSHTAHDRFEVADITVLNRTMATRSKPDVWAPFFTEGPSPILSALPHDWNLVAMAPDDAAVMDMVDALAAAIEAMRGPYRQLATVTKLLHLKRPRLVPVLDALVIEQIGGREESLVGVLGHMRRIGQENLAALQGIQRHLESLKGWDGRPVERTLARILDALLWSTHPGSALYPRLHDWRVHWVR